ncbi:hypothetical protein RYH73_20560 [Olivibacter sp. CPCC 100613]|uniref:hypothetical protein n=1 Tax=Olivibacter sp. CPCC 100613 TaxID=3079931 RepID=UPI002FFC103C
MKQIFKSRFRFIVIPILAVAFVFLISYLVMLLWNFSMATIFNGVHSINLWQAMALFVLSKILFGFGKGGRGGGPPWSKRKMRDKLAGMNEMDKEKMRTYMRERWCDWQNFQEDKSNEN